MESEVLRQIIHFSGVSFILASFVFGNFIVGIICIFCFLFLIFLSISKVYWKNKIFRSLINFADRFERKGKIPYKGAICFFFSMSVLFLFFPEGIARIAGFVLCVYDSIATIVGKHIGKARVFSKSLEGYFSGFILTVFLGSLIFSFKDIFLATLIAVFAESLPLEDNLTIPFSVSFFLLLFQYF